MRIRHGWSGEYRANQWGKADVSCDEEDLYRLLHECGIDADNTVVTSTEAFLLLNNETLRLLLVTMAERYDYPPDRARQEITDATTRRDAILNKIKLRVQPPDTPEPLPA